MIDPKVHIISLGDKVLGSEVRYADHDSPQAAITGKSSGAYSAGRFTLNLGDVNERVDLPKLLDVLAMSLSVLDRHLMTSETKVTAQAIVAREVALANEVAR